MQKQPLAPSCVGQRLRERIWAGFRGHSPVHRDDVLRQFDVISPKSACRGPASLPHMTRAHSGLPSLLRVCAGLLGAAWSMAARADYIDHFATRSDVGVMKVPSRGQTRVLVIPVFIDDQPYSAGSEEAFIDEIDAFFADTDDSVFDGGFRFSPYWRQASVGRFSPVATVATPVHFPTCPPLGPHENCQIPRGAGIADGDLGAAGATLKDALVFLNEVILCATAGPSAERRCTSGGDIDLADFDVSGAQEGIADGFVDGVIVISNAQFPGIALPVKDLSTQPLLTFLGPLPSFAYGEQTVSSVGIAGFASKPGRETFVSVHEFGHLLGFADLYNESGSTTDMPWSLMGGWFYSTAGSLLDPFSRVAAGWANVVDVSGEATLLLPSAARSGQVIKVGKGDEFFLIEHRKNEGDAIDGDLEITSGVVVQRVRLSKRPASAPGNYFNTLQNCVNCTAFDSLMMIEEADGTYDMQRNRGRDDAGDLFQAGQGMAPSDDTSPRSLQNPIFSTNLLSGEATGIVIDVVDSDDVSATVHVSAPVAADACVDLNDLCIADCVVDDSGHGTCGDFVAFPPVQDDDPPPGGAVGCDCQAQSLAGPWPMVMALAALAMRRRR